MDVLYKHSAEKLPSGNTSHPILEPHFVGKTEVSPTQNFIKKPRKEAQRDHVTQKLGLRTTLGLGLTPFQP